MFNLRNISLTLVVPLCLFSLYFAMVMGGYYYEHADLKQQLAKSQIEQLKKDLFRMRHVVDSAVQKQDFNQIDQEVALISTDMNMMVYVIVDKMSIIKFANHIIWKDSDANNVLEGYSKSIHKRVIQSNIPMLVANFDRLSIQGYYPIVNNSRFNYAQSIEVIYIEYDISELIANASNNLTSRFIQVWGVGAIILMVFCVWIYWLWILPLTRLSQAAKNIESDHFDGDFPCLSSEMADLKDYLNQVSGRLKRNQKRVNDAEQRWLFSVEGSRNGIWDWNIATGDVYVSDRWKEILGYQSYELDSDYSVWESRLHREDKEQVLNTLQQYIDGKSNEYESVHRLRHKDGKYIWVLDRGKVVEWTETGKPLRVIGIITDVSADVKSQRVDVEKHKPTGLTDFINRDSLTDLLYDLQVHSRKVNQFSAVLLINLDNFKLLNDALGHQLGDRLLMQIAARLSGAFSSTGFIARLGSDEFILLAKNLGTDVTQANKRALALASEVRQLVSRSFAIADQNLSISARVGVVTCDGVESLEPQTLLARADNALEHAKESRSNGCAIYHHQLDQAQVQSFKLNDELKIALEHQHLYLVFQPVVDSHGNVLSVEVLPRWHHEQYGFISPRKFIAAAELSDFIFEIELWLLEQVCLLLNKFESLGIEPPIMSMNIASRHFHQDHFVSIVMNRIQSAKVNSTKLQLELDEDIFVVNPLEAKAKIAELQAHGIKVALDNFGSGCCAFHQLQGIHFSQVKLVASYIDENHISAEAQTMLCALVQFASRLNYNVIAKQVETKLQLNKLIHAKCDGFQGYLFCRPLTEDDLIPLIKSHLTLNVV